MAAGWERVDVGLGWVGGLERHMAVCGVVWCLEWGGVWCGGWGWAVQFLAHQLPVR